MSDTLKVIQKFDSIGTNVKVDSLQEAKVINLYQEVKKTPLAAVTEAAVSSNQEQVQEIKAEETKTSHRDSLKRISDRERALNEKEKQIKEKLAQAEQFQEAYKKFDEDPTLIAKAMGKDTGEFLKKLQNKVFDIKEEYSPKPEQVVQQKLANLEEETKRLKEANWQTTKKSYINNNIIPIISNTPEKFELINKNKEVYASYLYDMMNTHWLATGGANGGEVWSADKLVEALEQELTEEKEKEIEELKKYPKFKNRFKEEVEVIKASPIKTITNSLGANASGGLPELPKENSDGAKIIYSASMDPKEARRQRTAAAIKAQFPDRFVKNGKK